MAEITFLTVPEFKAKINANKLAIVKSPKTDKLFVQADNGQNFRCASALDINMPMSVLIPESGIIADACLVNGSNANVLTTI